jgi:hypothetical protein
VDIVCGSRGPHKNGSELGVRWSFRFGSSLVSEVFIEKKNWKVDLSKKS